MFYRYLTVHVSSFDVTGGYDTYSDFVSSRRETYERNDMNNDRRKVSINNGYSGSMFFPVFLSLTARGSRPLVRSPLRTVTRVETTVTEQNSRDYTCSKTTSDVTYARNSV